jgi:tetratricopeptide (TPR) repeat protein
LAEHALWSVWFRLGTPCANRCLARATQSMDLCDFPAAQDFITRALELSPNFPEAYNQRAILHYLNERYDESLADCRRTVALMPQHFGAWAGMGHCYAHLSQPGCVFRSYQRAVSINPNLEGVRQALYQIRCCQLRGLGA